MPHRRIPGIPSKAYMPTGLFSLRTQLVRNAAVDAEDPASEGPDGCAGHRGNGTAVQPVTGDDSLPICNVGAEAPAPGIRGGGIATASHEGAVGTVPEYEDSTDRKTWSGKKMTGIASSSGIIPDTDYQRRDFGFHG
jgi:hypothetical protein